MSEATEGTPELGGSAGGADSTPNTEPTTQTQGGDDRYDRLLDRVDQLGNYTAEQMQALQQALEQQQPEYDEDEEDYLDLDDPDYEAQQDYRQLQELIRAEARQIAQETVGPIQQQRMAELYDDSLQAVEDKFQSLLYNEKGQPTELAETVMASAKTAADRLEIDAGQDPRFWSDVFEFHLKAHLADQHRERETPAGAQAALLESGGASAGAQAPPKDEMQGVRAILARSQSDPFA